MTWLLIAIAFLFALGGAMTALRGTREPARPARTVEETRSYFGGHEFVDTDGGVTFADVEPPGSPADKAGLVGGDIITRFDGQVVKNESDMMGLLKLTPPGKTVAVIYLRDGETKKTQLTTISEDEFEQLNAAFDNRPEGKGMFGFEKDRTTQISAPETRTFGVRMDYVQPNGPAMLFGIKEGDIITEFDGIPIRTAAELLARVRRAIPYNIVKVVVIRDGQRVELPIKLGRASR